MQQGWQGNKTRLEKKRFLLPGFFVFFQRKFEKNPGFFVFFARKVDENDYKMSFFEHSFKIVLDSNRNSKNV